jgi:hypothetical protein
MVYWCCTSCDHQVHAPTNKEKIEAALDKDIYDSTH